MVRPLKILVADDNVDAVTLMADALAGLGHEVTTAHHGGEALRLAQRAPFDVGIFDIDMPVLDGRAVAQQLRARGLPIRLIAVSGHGRRMDLASNDAAGFDHQFIKPVDLRELVAVLTPPTSGGSSNER